jgi:hypothetical protein
MSDTVIAASLTLDTAPAEQNVRSFKQQLKEAQAEALKTADAFGPVSKEALAASKRVAALKDTIQDAKETAALFDPGAKFQVFGNVIRTVAGGFSALTGAMALFGDKSGEVEKMLLKVQGALALVEGVNTIADSVKDFQRLNAVIQQTAIFQKANAAATYLASNAMRVFGISVTQTSTAFNVLKGAIIATGIGLLVVALGAAIQALSSFASESEKAAEAQKQLEDRVKRLTDAVKDQNSELSDTERVAVARAKAAGASEKEIYDIQQDYAQRRIDKQQALVDQISKLDKKSGEVAKKDLMKLYDDQAILRLGFQQKEREQREEQNKKLAEKDKEAAKRFAEEKKKEMEEAAAAEKEGLKQLQKLRDETYLIQIQDEANKARIRIVQAGEAERAAIWEQTKITDELRTQLLTESRAKQQALLDEFNAAEEEKAKEKELQRKEQEIQRLADSRNFILENLRTEADRRRQFAEEQIAVEQAVHDQRLALASQTAGILGGLTDLFGKNTAASKIAGLAQIAINTGVGFIDGLRIAQQSAKGTGPAAAFAFPVFYAAQIAAVLGAASRAKAILSSGSGSAGSSSPALPSVSVPAPLQPQSPIVTTTQLDADSLNTIGNATTRAYVVESDITDEQEKIARISRAARLGG